MTEISLWGVAAVVVLYAMAGSVFALSDRRMMRRFFRATVFFLASLLLVGAYMWGLYRLDSIWTDLGWLLLVGCLVAYFSLARVHLPQRQLLAVLALSVLVGFVVVACSVRLLVSVSHTALLIPVTALLAGQLLASVSASWQVYVSSLRHTQEHYRYLMANGASHLEAVMPSVRRSLRAAVMPSLKNMASPVVIAPPLLLCGLLLAGLSPVIAVVITSLLQLAMLSASVLTTALSLFLADRYLFDRSGNLMI